MVNYIYVVHSDIDENNLYAEFNTFDEAVDYAEANVEDQTWVEQVEVEVNDFGEVEEVYNKETVWSYQELIEAVAESYYDEEDKNKRDSDDFIYESDYDFDWDSEYKMNKEDRDFEYVVAIEGYIIGNYGKDLEAAKAAAAEDADACVVKAYLPFQGHLFGDSFGELSDYLGGTELVTCDIDECKQNITEDVEEEDDDFDFSGDVFLEASIKELDSTGATYCTSEVERDSCLAYYDKYNEENANRTKVGIERFDDNGRPMKDGTTKPLIKGLAKEDLIWVVDAESDRYYHKAGPAGYLCVPNNKKVAAELADYGADYNTGIRVGDIKKVNEDIECDVELEKPDNAVVDCKAYDVVAHSEDEKPVDCKMEKKPLEKPLTDSLETTVDQDLADHRGEQETVKYTLEEPLDYKEEETKAKGLDESQGQEISASYKQLSKLYGKDIEELVYGPEGFMATCYPNGFPDFAGDVIYSEKYWDEFEKWANLEKVEEPTLADQLGEDLEVSYDETNIDSESLKKWIKDYEEKAAEYKARMDSCKGNTKLDPEAFKKYEMVQAKLKEFRDALAKNESLGDDMSDDDFLEEFGKALADKKNCKDGKCDLEEAKDTKFNKLSNIADKIAANYTKSHKDVEIEVDYEAGGDAYGQAINLYVTPVEAGKDVEAYAKDCLEKALGERYLLEVSGEEIDDFYEVGLYIRSEDIEENLEESVRSDLDSEYIDGEFSPSKESWATFGVWSITEAREHDNEGGYITVAFNDLEDCIDATFDDDGAPTYVPYGDTSVLYDDGKGGVSEVTFEASGYDDVQYQNLEEEDITEEEMCALLNCTKAELAEFVNKLATDALEMFEDSAKDWAEENADRFLPEPDYDSYYDEAFKNPLKEDLGETMVDYNNYIEYLQKEIKDEEAALEKATNSFIKKAIERRLKAFKDELEKALPQDVKSAENKLPEDQSIDEIEEK